MHFKKRLLFYAFKGVKNEPDESKKGYIIYLNLLGTISFFVNFISGIIFFCTGEILGGCAFLFSSPFLLIWPFYFNRNGLKLISRILWVLYADFLIIFSACLFSHESSLDHYYLCLAVNCNFMYSQKENMWLIFSLFVTLGFFIIESTSLQDYLPALNLINDFSRADKVVLSGLIVTVVLDVFVAVYINSLRELNLLEKQKQLEDSQRLVLVQNDDLKTFSIAASHSMQTPLYVSKFFLQKINESSFSDTKEPEHKKYLELIENGLLQIEHLVSGLFSYNRIINLENEAVIFNLSAEINSIQKFITPRYFSSRVMVPIINRNVVLNKMLFSIIIQNLIDNGLKYNRSAVPVVKIKFRIKKDSIDILIMDNGIGIPEMYFNRIFEPFMRIEQDPNFKVGNGLGLAGAKRAAERIGGNLVCEESSQNGTVFKLSIPNSG